jgi:N-carbamoylputrescine amidase
MSQILTALDSPFDSPAQVSSPMRGKLRIALIQEEWLGDINLQKNAYLQAVEEIAPYLPDLIILQELSLYPYACTRPDAQDNFAPEDLHGPSYTLAAQMAAASNACVVISFYENAADGKFNSAITVNPGGEIILQTRKTHIPVTAGYYEDKYFDQGESAVSVAQVKGARIGTPTCWDQWFPELARSYGLINTDLICYPTAIGTEPDHPEFDTQPLWRCMMVAHGIANGMFVTAVNRFGTEDGITFYGSSFISDPYGREILTAPRDKAAILIADLHLDYKKDWLDLFPFFTTRRPEMYSSLTQKGE